MGAGIYRVCVSVREWAERRKLNPLIAFVKTATATVSRYVRAGGAK